MEACGRPGAVYYYDQLDDLDRSSLDEQQQLLVEFADSNIEITTHDWQFDTGALDGLRRSGLVYPDVTPASIAVCLDWFLARTPRAQAFVSAQAQRDRAPVRVFQVPRGARRQVSTGPGVETADRGLADADAA